MVIMASQFTTKWRDDMLNLRTDPQCKKMLYQHGSSFPHPEKVIYSSKLIKINRKGKEQGVFEGACYTNGEWATHFN